MWMKHKYHVRACPRWENLACGDAPSSLHERVGRLVVDGRQAGDVADELIQQCRLYQVRLLRDERLLGQDYLLGGGGICGEQAPVDVTAVTQIWVITVLEIERETRG